MIKKAVLVSSGRYLVLFFKEKFNAIFNKTEREKGKKSTSTTNVQRMLDQFLSQNVLSNY